MTKIRIGNVRISKAQLFLFVIIGLLIFTIIASATMKNPDGMSV